MRIRTAAVLALAGAAVLVPVWVSPLLVTTDGPSHVYNAMVAAAARAGRPPYAALLEAPISVRPAQLSMLSLEAFGHVLPWEAAERVLVSLIMAATLGVVLLRSHGLGWPVTAALAVLGAWLAHSWFVWMGFYDFALSLVEYVGMILLLAHPVTRRRQLALAALLLLLYCTHFFTLAVSAGLLLTTALYRKRTGENPRPELRLVGLAIVLLLLGVRAGGTEGAQPIWAGPWPAMVGLAVGDVVRSFHPGDAVGGIALVGSCLVAVVIRLRAAGTRPPAEEVFGIGLLGLSLVAPESIGVGGRIPLRLQILGILSLLGAVAAAVRTLRGRWVASLAGVVMLGFLGHAAYAVAVARDVADDERLLEGMLVAAGATEGAWVRTCFEDNERGLFQIPGYAHLVDRIATRRRLIVLDNYQAYYSVFAVRWRTRPDQLTIRTTPTGFAFGILPGQLDWTPALYLLRESEWSLEADERRLTLGPTVTEEDFAVTRIQAEGGAAVRGRAATVSAAPSPRLPACSR